MKKLISAILCIIIALSAGITAFAQDDGHTHEFICVKIDEENHYFACECGEEYSETHSFCEWKDNNDAGLFTSGTHTASCEECGFEKTEKVIGSSVFFHPYFELYYVLRDFVFGLIDKLLAL